MKNGAASGHCGPELKWVSTQVLTCGGLVAVAGWRDVTRTLDSARRGLTRAHAYCLLERRTAIDDAQ